MTNFKPGDTVTSRKWGADYIVNTVSGDQITFEDYPGMIYTNSPDLGLYLVKKAVKPKTLDDLREVVSSLREQGMTVEVSVTETVTTTL